MGIIATSEFWSLIFVIAGLYTALKILAARREINSMPKPQDDGQAQEDESQRRRMVQEADSKPCADLEPFCGEGKKP